ncbi:twin-arginine translocation signal domain-containing protein [Humitalea sp. 24SJ18S-53]|uniref:twin-arginine translocation signal domain-containing protein n=1 Tax=Humitalea sp. 24SJ18S-53 TaxID=3422307 RepID=UPI003D66697C
MANDTTPERRGFLKALGLGAGAAVAATTTAQAAMLPGWDRADAVRGTPTAKESQADKTKARYSETAHVADFYRTNRY